jgi:hypothetical protein
MDVSQSWNHGLSLQKTPLRQCLPFEPSAVSVADWPSLYYNGTGARPCHRVFGREMSEVVALRSQDPAGLVACAILQLAPADLLLAVSMGANPGFSKVCS